ncbi:MAG: branched-chain amino acid ABC transporter permease [Armatimonadetes bacterium]|nr:branched-chain amino acid ABC transporter permease [Armatimonadota bacterium]NIM23128.1 branched-chain amino acid ABC transporter permease [Armatimonadota bacterium]NIM66996.1 branched-chain amino acid ABC transporter permease [Armatimonadota bacterium]NIM75530.1 branched-chain amino acid ABC transporter permease [Armatimonadota bacterium]NIN05185.1 branched-chain amino acid ABC transporter permease [Armatimonadota bacterium]
MSELERFGLYFVQGLAWGSLYALIALGYTMVYGVLRLINFAHGDVLMVGAYIALFCITLWHLPLLVAIVLAVAGCALLGVLIERGAYRPLRRQPRLTMLITAIGVSLVIENLAQLFFGAAPRHFPAQIGGRLGEGLEAASHSLQQSSHILISPQQIFILITAALLFILLQLIVGRTRFGRAMRAISFDRETAALMGINTDRVISLTFALGSALAAVAGVLAVLGWPKVWPMLGFVPGIKAFIAAVVGGIGNLTGAVLGGMIMGMAEYMVAGYISSEYKDAIAFALLIIILILRPTGLTGRGMIERA